LGLDPGDVFQEALSESILKLAPGDKLLLFTDGIIEAMNNNKEEFGEKRLLKFVKTNRHLPATALREGILAEIKAFSAEAAQHDDLTMVIVDANRA